VLVLRLVFMYGMGKETTPVYLKFSNALLLQLYPLTILGVISSTTSIHPLLVHWKHEL